MRRQRDLVHAVDEAADLFVGALSNLDGHRIDRPVGVEGLSQGGEFRGVVEVPWPRERAGWQAVGAAGRRQCELPFSDVLDELQGRHHGSHCFGSPRCHVEGIRDLGDRTGPRVELLEQPDPRVQGQARAAQVSYGQDPR